MISDKLKLFLINNNIYSLESLSKLSGRLLTSLRGYSDVKYEIPNLIKEHQSHTTTTQTNGTVSKTKTD